MANVIRIKNSGTANSAPTSLELGELAINYNDGKIFYKNSSNAIVQFGSSGGSGGVTVSDTPPSSPSAGDLWYESDTGKSFVYYDSFWVEIGAGSGVGLDSIVLGTDTTGNYVASLVAGTGVTLSNNSGESTTPTIAVDTSAIQVRVANVSDTEIGYLDGVTSAIQTQINTKANSNSSPVITLSGDLSGSATLTNLGNATINATIVANSVALGSDTAGDYVQSLVAGTGITLSNNSGEGTTPTVAVNTSTIATLASPVFTGNVTVSNNLIVSGNLTVSGSTTTVNTETVTIDDNIIVLNNNATGSPTENAGIEVERGTSNNVLIRWNETADKWQFTNDGTNYTDFGAGGATISDTAPASPEAGSLWFESDTAQTFVYYDSSWIEIGATAMGATVSTTAPNSPIGGQIWFNSDTGGTYVYYGSAWVEVGAAPVNVMLQAIDAKGDLLIGTADNTVGKVSVGSNSQLLRANSSTATGVEWFTPPYAPAASPTFTGTVVLPSDTSIGNVSSTEIGYVDGVTSAIQTQLDSKLTATTAITSNRNVVINGDFKIWQRGTSFTASSSYTADRFLVDTGTVTRQTGTGQFPYCLRIANSTGNPAVRHAIELPAAGLAGLFTVGSTWTVSFYAKTSTTVTSNLSFYAAFCDSNLVNNNQIVLDTALPVPTTSWARYSKTFTIGVSPLGANLAMTIVPFLNSGAYAGNFEITGVQLEAGAVATPFEFDDFGTTLAKCQRYYEKSYAYATAPASAGGLQSGLVFAGSYNAATQGSTIAWIPFQVAMRAAPTVTIYGYSPATAGVVSNVQGTNLAAGSGTSTFISEYGTNVYNNSGGSITPNLGGYMFHFVASAEL